MFLLIYDDNWKSLKLFSFGTKEEQNEYLRLQTCQVAGIWDGDLQRKLFEDNLEELCHFQILQSIRLQPLNIIEMQDI